MKVTIDKNELYLDPEIIVKCREIDEVLQDIISYIGIADKNMIGEVEGEIFFIPLNSILYNPDDDSRIMDGVPAGVQFVVEKSVKTIISLVLVSVMALCFSVNIFAIDDPAQYVTPRWTSIYHIDLDIVFSGTTGTFAAVASKQSTASLIEGTVRYCITAFCFSK